MDTIFQIESFEKFNKVIEDILLNLYVSGHVSDTLDPEIIQAAKEDMKKLIESSNLNLVTLSNQLQNKGWGEDKVNTLVSFIENNKSELLYATIQNHNSKYGRIIRNFNWSLKLVKGTNDLKTLNYPLLQLGLILQDSDGKLTQLLCDVEKEMLYKLISILENRLNEK